MPEEIVKPAEGFPNHKEQNEVIKQKLADQNLQTTFTIEDLTDTAGALDALAEKVVKTPDEVVPELPEVKLPNPVVDEAAAKKLEEETAKREADLKSADVYFKDSPALPPNASPKSSEAFTSIKIRAAQDIIARDQKIEELGKQIKDFEEKLKNPIPAELDAELKELREWRAKMDVEVDPKFKEFDKSNNLAREFIYSQLKQSPVISDAIIEEIKSHGGPEKVKWEKLFAAIGDPTTQRIIESKLADIEMTNFNKAQAIKAAKDNIGQYIGERQQAFANSVNSHTTSTKQILNDLTGRLDWLKPQTADAKADDSAKKEVAEHNAFITTIQKQIDEASVDDSPQMRAILLTGMAQLFNLQRVHDGTAAKLVTVEKALAEATEKLDRYKNASRSRNSESAAPANGHLPKEKAPDFNARPTEALDELMKSVMEKRAAAAV